MYVYVVQSKLGVGLGCGNRNDSSLCGVNNISAKESNIVWVDVDI